MVLQTGGPENPDGLALTSFDKPEDAAEFVERMA